MIEKKFVLRNEEGLHARPATIFAKTSMKFTCDLTMYKGEDRAKAYQPKSILSVMTIGAAKGDEITIVAEGADEAAAMEAISELFDKNFDE